MRYVEVLGGALLAASAPLSAVSAGEDFPERNYEQASVLMAALIESNPVWIDDNFAPVVSRLDRGAQTSLAGEEVFALLKGCGTAALDPSVLETSPPDAAIFNIDIVCPGRGAMSECETGGVRIALYHGYQPSITLLPLRLETADCAVPLAPSSGGSTNG